MTYNDHGPWEITPGPIGPLRWQRASVAALERVIQADEIFLGVANYGYAWRPHANDNLTVAQARKLARTRARWNVAASAPATRSRDPTQLPRPEMIPATRPNTDGRPVFASCRSATASSLWTPRMPA